jgi:translation initiation factor IF-2
VQFSNVSAKQKTNLDDLLEKVLLVADAELELTANPNAEASGPIIESRLDVGRGPVATMLVHRGTLRVGDAIVAGDAYGKVRALHDYRGEKVKEAGPARPSRSSASTRRRPRASSRAWSRTSARHGRSRSARASGSAPSSSHSARRAASRSRRSSHSWAKALSRI